MPHVSCIMPTRKIRENFIPLAIDNFLKQDYKDAELIIVDDGESSIRELPPLSENIKYLSNLNSFSSLGYKRNYACSQASGNIILHWDDDDWYAYDWISKQIAIFEDESVDITGLNALHFFNPKNMKHWQFVYNYNNMPWVAGATLAYRKKHWEQHPFSDITVGEDNHFVWHSKGRIQLNTYNDGFVSMLHSGNTSPKYTSDKQWQLQTSDEMARIMGIDLLRYRALF